MSSPDDTYSSHPDSPRKRRRTESAGISVSEHQYNDAYRELLNEAIVDASSTHSGTQDRVPSISLSTSPWSKPEQASFFGALKRYSQDALLETLHDVRKSKTEARALLLRMTDAVMQGKRKGLTLRDIPAAIEFSRVCEKRLDKAADALAWYQEDWESAQERERYGRSWLITPVLSAKIEIALGSEDMHGSSSNLLTAASQPIRNSIPCTPCRVKKRRCDRGMPCGTCKQSKAICVYGENDTIANPFENTREAHNLKAHQTETWLADIPEARLLHPTNMLTLSQNVFMNRASDIPSPWQHWSTYSSEVSAEPAMFRTALADFHALTVSMTKRIVKASIFQATSRLRSQRKRSTRGVQPFLRRRDVLTALDILGLPADSKNFWRGAARRCGVHVTRGQYATSRRIGRARKEVPWAEVEQIMDYEDPSKSIMTNSVQALSDNSSQILDTSEPRDFLDNPPIPLDSLILEDINDRSSESRKMSDATASNTQSDDGGTHPHLSSRSQVVLGHDPVAYLTKSPDEDEAHTLTVEKSDQEANRREGHILMERLGFDIRMKNNEEDVEVYDQENVLDTHRQLEEVVDDWRAWTDYRAPWEESQVPVSAAEFTANEKIMAQDNALGERALQDAGVHISTDTDSSSSKSACIRPRDNVELRTRGPRNYAVMQYFSDTFDDSNIDPESTLASDRVLYVPTTSSALPENRNEPPSSEMDWTT